MPERKTLEIPEITLPRLVVTIVGVGIRFEQGRPVERPELAA